MTYCLRPCVHQGINILSHGVDWPVRDVITVKSASFAVREVTFFNLSSRRLACQEQRNGINA
jgi:hypothetical protein